MIFKNNHIRTQENFLNMIKDVHKTYSSHTLLLTCRPLSSETICKVGMPAVTTSIEHRSGLIDHMIKQEK